MIANPAQNLNSTYRTDGVTLTKEQTLTLSTGDLTVSSIVCADASVVIAMFEASASTTEMLPAEPTPIEIKFRVLVSEESEPPIPIPPPTKRSTIPANRGKAE